MATIKFEIPPSPVNVESSTPICSICFEPAIENNSLAIAKLKCGHTFHLSCIGCLFNAKGAMICPNCRDAEHSQWLYCIGNGMVEAPAPANEEDSGEDSEESNNDHDEMNEIAHGPIDVVECPVHRHRIAIFRDGSRGILIREEYSSNINGVGSSISRGVQIAPEHISHNGPGPSTSSRAQIGLGNVASRVQIGPGNVSSNGAIPGTSRGLRDPAGNPINNGAGPSIFRGLQNGAGSSSNNIGAGPSNFGANPFQHARLPSQNPTPAQPTPALYNGSNHIIFINVGERIRSYLPMVQRDDPEGAYYGVDTSIVHQNQRFRCLYILGRNIIPTESGAPQDVISPPPLRWSGPGYNPRHQELNLSRSSPSLHSQGRGMGSNTYAGSLDLTISARSFMDNGTSASTSASASASTSTSSAAAAAPRGFPIWVSGNPTRVDNANEQPGARAATRRRMRLFGVDT